ncbi:MAG: cache domain-containing protein, partial [Lysinibacillus sp.]
MLKNLSIKLRLSILTIVSLTIVLVAIAVITITMFKKEVGTIIENQTVEKMQLLDAFLNDHLATPIALVENTAAEIETAKTPKQIAKVEQELALAARSINGILGLHAAYDGDRILYSSEKLTLADDYDATKRDWYIDAKENAGQIRITEPYVDALTGSLIVGISKTMANNQGIVTLDLDLSFLEGLFSSVNIGQEGYTFVVDNSGNVLYHPKYEQNKSLVEEPVFESFLAETFTQKELNGETVYVSRYHNELMNWQIGSIYTEDEIDHVYKDIVLPIVLLITFCVFILAAVFYYVIARTIKPINTVTNFAEQVAQGNLKERIEVESKDEIGRLGSTFNEMTDGLKTMIHNVDDTASQLNAFSQELSASVEENVQSIHQVVENIQSVADQTRDQLKSTDNVQQAMTDMSDEVTIISQNMVEVKQSSLTAEQKTTNGVLAISDVIQQMEFIEESAKQTATNFNQLIQVAHEIDTFSLVIATDAVRAFQDQNNLSVDGIAGSDTL